MPKTFKTTPSADEIAEMASRGEDISAYFTNKFTVVRPVRRVNVDLTQGMLRELDQRAAKLNISRQAVIKTLLSRALEEGRASKPRPRRRAGRPRRWPQEQASITKLDLLESSMPSNYLDVGETEFSAAGDVSQDSLYEQAAEPTVRHSTGWREPMSLIPMRAATCSRTFIFISGAASRISTSDVR